MKAKPRNMVRLLGESTRLARRVLRYCEENKVNNGLDVWSFALLHRIIRTGRTVDVLIKKGLVHDAKLITRALLDSCLDLCLIQSGRIKRAELLHMFEYERANDAHEYVKWLASSTSMKVEKFIQKYPQFTSGVDDYRRAEKWRKPQGDKTRKKDVKRIWREVSQELKLKSLERFRGATSQLGYSLRYLANSEAHARPSALLETMTMTLTKVTYHSRMPRRNFLFSPQIVAMEASVFVLIACDRLIDSYYLPVEYGQQLETLVQRKERSAPVDDYWKL